MKRCAFCQGGLGLISHRHKQARFCSLAHKKAFVHRQQEDRKKELARLKWVDYLSRPT